MLLQWQPLEHLVQPLLQFRHFVQEYNETEVLPAPELSWWAQRVPKSPPSKKKKQSQHAEQAASVMERIHAMEAGGWVTGYTDGSAKLHPQVGLVGGYGARIPVSGFELSGYLPVDESQTSNRAELMAAIALLGSLPRHILKLLIATDSDYLCCGIQGPVYKWQAGN